uniref:cytochrome b n=1 Tax=Bactronophorus thoracites TaxID=2663719 RepID=UPI0020293940|nr:cytochrome b [Bactronophorus thoracites]UPX89043.1 cytochrome b [Bactronophorus thoracites]UPX89055.1 cytochrome b [Bactronophorus thoracites]
MYNFNDLSNKVSYHALRKEVPVLKAVSGSLYDLPVPANLSYLWNYGSLLGCCLVLQITTGIFLAMHYTPHVLEAFNSVVSIGRDVKNGWVIRSFHANGASFFFIMIYVHIARGLYYHSFYLRKTWIVGVHMFLLLMLVAFTGYVLPWGQMSYWAATVITNLATAVPVIGEILVSYIWGGSTVCDATLKRFYVFHMYAPFLLGVLSAVHMVYLHETGSGNPLGVSADVDSVPFHPYYTYKDLFGIVVFLTAVSGVVLFSPDLFTDPENFIPADPAKTPLHIQPEWYFLFAYAILRSVPNKLGGVVLLVLSVLVLYLLPFFRKSVIKGSQFNYVSQALFWGFVFNFVVLSYFGTCTVEYPYDRVPLLSTIIYFVFFILYLPLSRLWEKAFVVRSPR